MYFTPHLDKIRSARILPVGNSGFPPGAVAGFLCQNRRRGPSRETTMTTTATAATATALIAVRPESALPRRLLEFAKTALINIFAYPYATVCDLYCADGADIDKFDDAHIGHYIGIDASLSGISEACEPWETPRKPYSTEFCEMDPSAEYLVGQLEGKGLPADIVCCLQHLQMCFESEERARGLMCNVSAMLRSGGYFFGIIADSSAIWTKYQKNVEASHNKGLKPNTVPTCIKSENYVITFEVEEEKFPCFGKRYQIKFPNDITSETHYLVHFPSLIRLAREAGLDFIEIQNLTEFYDDNRAQLSGMLSSFGANFVDPRGKLVPRSFDVLGLYSMFVFQKPDPDITAPLLSPMTPEGSEMHEEHLSQEAVVEEEKNGVADTGNIYSECKGILGPGPADLRFSETVPFSSF